MSEESKNGFNNANNANNTNHDDLDQDSVLINSDDEDDDQGIFLVDDNDQDDEDKLEIETKAGGLSGLDTQFNRSVASENPSESTSPNTSNSFNNINNENNGNESNETRTNVNNKNDNNNSNVDDVNERTWGFGNDDREDTFDEVDETDDTELNRANQNNNQEEISKPTPDNKSSSSGFLSFFKKGGHFNFRSIGAMALIGGFIVAVLFSMNSSKPETKETKVNVPLPEQSRTAENRVDTSELDPVTTKYFPEERPVEASPLPTVTIPAVVAPAVVEPIKSEKPVEVEESKEFGIELRAGTQAALKTLNPTKEEKSEKGEEISLDGLSIQMILLEPFRSGISSIVKAQVMADVVNSKGEVLIRANSRVQMPFERFEIDGRVMNNSSQPAQVFLPNGKKLNIIGIVKGLDGFAGIKGKVKKLSKGNVFARMGRTVGRVGARVVGVTTGGFAGRGLEDTINESVDSSTGFIPNGRIVEVLPGTRFTFTATQL